MKVIAVVQRSLPPKSQSFAGADIAPRSSRALGWRTRLPAMVLALTASASARSEPCWTQAADRYGIAQELLYAVARTESGLDARAVNRGHIKRTSSYDIGLMQINSRHLPRLAKLGITEADLYNACTNLHVGAWLLADAFSRLGATWNAVGSYNASCVELKGDACTRARAAYAWRVYGYLPRDMRRASATASPQDAIRAGQVAGLVAKVKP